MKKLIILNPIASLITIIGGTSMWQEALSSTENCRKALAAMALDPCAKNVISCLRTIQNRFKTVIVTDYDSAVVRIVAHYFDIPAIAVFGGKQSKVSQYNRALRKTGSTAEEAVVVSGIDTDLREAEAAGITGLCYGVNSGYPNTIRCMEDLCRHLGIRWEKKESTLRNNTKKRQTC